MVQVEFDLAESFTAETGEMLELPRIELIPGIEEAMARHSAVRIMVARSDLRIAAQPVLDTLSGHVPSRPCVLRLVMIDYAEEDIGCFPM